MKISKRIQAKSHMFMPGDTVQAVVKKFNLHDVTKEEMCQLIDQFKDINPPLVLKPGINALIPILDRHQDKVFTH
jgi:hypothetical protein